MSTEKRALVFVLQDALGYAQDSRDEALAQEIQSYIDEIKRIETEVLCAETGIDDADDNYLSDGECLDDIIETFGLEVGR